MAVPIEFVSVIARRFPDAELLVTGVEDPDTRAHGANESLHLGEFARACLAEALLLTRLAAPGPDAAGSESTRPRRRAVPNGG